MLLKDLTFLDPFVRQKLDEGRPAVHFQIAGNCKDPLIQISTHCEVQNRIKMLPSALLGCRPITAHPRLVLGCWI